MHQGQGAVKLTNIKVTEWDGTFEDPAMVTPNKTQDMARLKNGDRLIGSVKSIRDGKLSIEGAGTVLDVPVTRVKQVELASAQPSGAKSNEQTVRAYFTSGAGSLRFNLVKWTIVELSATSENFGTASFKPAAFSRIVFDLKGDRNTREDAR